MSKFSLLLCLAGAANAVSIVAAADVFAYSWHIRCCNNESARPSLLLITDLTKAPQLQVAAVPANATLAAAHVVNNEGAGTAARLGTAHELGTVAPAQATVQAGPHELRCLSYGNIHPATNRPASCYHLIHP